MSNRAKNAFYRHTSPLNQYYYLIKSEKLAKSVIFKISYYLKRGTEISLTENVVRMACNLTPLVFHMQDVSPIDERG